jgi:hypothetical protein
LIKKWILLGALAAMPLAGARADTAMRAYQAMEIPPENALTGSVVQSRVMPGDAKQVVAVVTYFTGKRAKSKAVNVRLEVFRDTAGNLVRVYARDFGEELGYQVAKGEMQLVDLDSDGINEIIVTFESLQDPLIRQRWGDVIVYDGEFRSAWFDLMEYDGTKAARKVPEERRDHFIREVGVAETLRTQGRTLFMIKEVLAVAGEELPEPKVVQESYPLRRD